MGDQSTTLDAGAGAGAGAGADAGADAGAAAGAAAGAGAAQDAVEPLDATMPAPAPPAFAANHPSTPPTPATRIADRYELLALVGTGGMGSVYRARDTELGVIVALKVLRRERLRSAEMLARFRREVSLARKVTHRNVARTFDIGEHEGDRFLTMEFIEGESLALLIARQRFFDLPAFLDLGCEICLGLEAAHRVGVIHLDLKPDNLLLGKDGHLVISDFGIARAIGAAEGSGAASGGGGGAGGRGSRGMMAGTPAYMAPEQVTGGELDEAADIYALGAILFEMLTGESAWDGSTAFAVAAARLLKPPPDPRERRPDIPEEIAAIVLRCMAREPSERFAAAADVRSALEAARRARPSASHQRVQKRTATTATAKAATIEEAAAACRTVAVLPFRNRGELIDDYLADGFTEEIIDALTDSPRIRVRARGAVMSFKGTDRDPRDVGRLLGVEAVVEGSLRRASGMLHVNVRVIGVEDGYHLWARRFDVPERQMLRVTDQIAVLVARALETPHDDNVDSDLRREHRANDDVALDLYMRGRYELNKGSAEYTRAAIALFERALTRLPNDPMILAAYAQAQFRRFTFGEVDDPTADEAGDIAERNARRALELSPTLGEARVALANLRLSVGDGVGAAQEVVEALRVGGWTSPLVQDLHGRLLAEVGSPEKALEHLRSAIAIEPTLERARVDVLRLEALLGRQGANFEEVQSEHHPPGSVFWFLSARLALWHTDTSWAERLRARIEPLDFPQKASAMRILRVRLGELDVNDIAAELLTIGQRRARSVRAPIFIRQLLCELYLHAGRTDEALATIEKAVELGLMDAVWLEHCPLLKTIAADPRLVPLREIVTTRARAVSDVLASLPPRTA